MQWLFVLWILASNEQALAGYTRLHTKTHTNSDDEMKHRGLLSLSLWKHTTVMCIIFQHRSASLEEGAGTCIANVSSPAVCIQHGALCAVQVTSLAFILCIFQQQKTCPRMKYMEQGTARNGEKHSFLDLLDLCAQESQKRNTPCTLPLTAHGQSTKSFLQAPQ